MVNTIHYLGYESTYIEGKPYVVVYVVSLNNKNIKKSYIHKIYKPSNKDILELVQNLHVFDELTSIITYAIKSDGKITLDIIL